MFEQITNLNEVFHRVPQAVAVLTGSRNYPQISGTVSFYQTGQGVIVAAQVSGLPATGGMPTSGGDCGGSFFAFHIHEGDSCSGNAEDPFANVKQHYNPAGCEHPFHAGDMPPLLGNQGYALSAFLTDRFSVREIMGRTVIIHSGTDDFHTQPSGNAGTKIACGEIRPVARR